MIYLLFGENDFIKNQQLSELSADLSDTVDRLDGEYISVNKWRELLMGQTLFDGSRTVVIADLSLSDVWSVMPDVSLKGDNNIILLETKIDKRTKTYKWLQKNAKVIECQPLGERDRQHVINWVIDWASSEYQFKLDRLIATELVDRLGYDQMRLDQFLKQLSLADSLNQELLDVMLPLPKSESVFGLLSASLNGRNDEVRKIVAYLELTDGQEGAYMTFGLLVSQLVILNALVLGGSQDDIVKDFSANPYAVRNVKKLAANLGPAHLKKINDAMGLADIAMKTTSVSPWLIIENALTKISLAVLD